MLPARDLFSRLAVAVFGVALGVSAFRLNCRTLLKALNENPGSP
jgi:hypothetical protein